MRSRSKILLPEIWLTLMVLKKKRPGLTTQPRGMNWGSQGALADSISDVILETRS